MAINFYELDGFTQLLCDPSDESKQILTEQEVFYLPSYWHPTSAIEYIRPHKKPFSGYSYQAITDESLLAEQGYVWCLKIHSSETEEQL